MKRIFSVILSLGFIAAVGCVKVDVETPALDGDFTVVLSTDATKTVNDGLSTKWVEGDKINVFVAEAGSDVSATVSCGAFEFKGDDQFKGTLAIELDPAKNYDWYFVYPYDAASESAAAAKMTVGSLKGQVIVQNGNDSMAHLAGGNLPMVAYAKNVAGDAEVSARMKHVAAVWEIEVVNKTDQVMRVEEITLPRNLDGKFRLGECVFNFASYNQDAPIGWHGIITTEDATSQLNPVLSVENAELIPIGGSAKFDLPCMPFKYNPAENNYQRIAVNGYSKDLSVAEGRPMTQGVITRVKFNYDLNLKLNFTDYEFLKAVHAAGVQGMVENINWSTCNGDGYIPGITCKQIGEKWYVTQIKQSDPEKRIKILPEKMELPELTRLDFSFDGNPSLKGQELPKVWNTPKLQYCCVQKCGLTGTIPQGFADNPSIKEFYLGNNDFYGALPHEWAAAGTIEIFNCNDGNTGLGYLVPADLDVCFAWETTFQGDKPALKLGGTAETWQGFEIGWGQRRYERYDDAAQLGNTSVWSDWRLLNGKALGEKFMEVSVWNGSTWETQTVDADERGFWSYIGHVKKELKTWNQAEADAYTAKCRAERQ